MQRVPATVKEQLAGAPRAAASHEPATIPAGAGTLDLPTQIDRSPRLVAQRQELNTIFGPAIQRLERPAMQIQDGVPVNDDAALEREADVMGGRALSLGQDGLSVQLQTAESNTQPVVQRAVGFEFQTYNDSTKLQIVDGTQPIREKEEDEDQKEYDKEQAQIVEKRKNWPRDVEGGPRKPGETFGRDVVAPPEWIEYAQDDEERYAQGGGVKIEKDGPDLEFVTNAFEESDSGRSGLTQAIRAIILTALALEKRLTLTSSIAMRGPGLTAGADARDTVRVKSTGPMKAQVQATLGVKLDALDRLIHVLGSAPQRDSSNDLDLLFDKEVQRPQGRQAGPQPEPKSKAKAKKEPTLVDKLGSELGNNVGNKTQKGLVRAYQRAAMLVDKVMRGRPADTVRLRGIVHLIGLYVLGSGEKAKYAKARTPIMSRTNLADAVFALSKGEKALFAGEIIPAMNEWFEHNKIAPSKTLYSHFPEGEVRAMGLTEEENANITIEGWMQGLLPVDEDTPGEDQTSSFDGFAVISNANKVDHPDPGNYQQKWFAGEYGQRMESSTDIGRRETTQGPKEMATRMDGLVLELRNLGNDNLDVSEWASFALSLFDLVLLVNSSDAREEAALAESMLAQRTFSTDLGDAEVAGIFKGARDLLKSS